MNSSMSPERKKRIHNYLGGEDPVVRYVEGNKMGLKRLWSEDVVVPASYDWIDVPTQHCVLVRKKDKFGYVTIDGGIVSDCIYDCSRRFSEGRAAVYAKERFCGFIDEDGKEVKLTGSVVDTIKEFTKMMEDVMENLGYSEASIPLVAIANRKSSSISLPVAAG